MCMVRIRHATYSAVPNSRIPDFEYNASGSSLYGNGRDASVIQFFDITKVKVAALVQHINTMNL